MNVKPKLLLASSYFFPKMGGLERYSFEMAKSAFGNGYDVSVITSGESKEVELDYISGFRIYRLPVQFKFSNTPFNFKWYPLIKKTLKNEKPDIINIHLPVPGLADLVCSAAKNTPIVVTYHAGSMRKDSFLIDTFIKTYERFFLPFMLKKADQIICSSDFVRFAFLGKYKNRSVTITPGVDTNYFVKRKIIPTNRNILFVGNFNYEWKGLKYLREAIKLIPRVTLHVVGEGVEVNSPNTIYHGQLQGKDLVKQIHKARVLVLPSTSSAESFGMVLIEAMACGVPVIGTSIGGIKTIINDKKNGLLVLPRDIESLSNSISYILDNQSEADRLAEKAYKQVIKYFTWDKSARKYLEVINGLLPPAKSVRYVEGEKKVVNL